MGAGTFGGGEGNNNLDDPDLNDPAENEMSMGVARIVTERRMKAASEQGRAFEAKVLRLVVGALDAPGPMAELAEMEQLERLRDAQ